MTDEIQNLKKQLGELDDHVNARLAKYEEMLTSINPGIPVPIAGDVGYSKKNQHWGLRSIRTGAHVSELPRKTRADFLANIDAVDVLEAVRAALREAVAHRIKVLDTETDQ